MRYHALSIMKASHPIVRRGVMLGSMLAVVVGAWTIYRSFATTPVETFAVTERLISKTVEVPANVLETSVPITITASHDGIVSVVSALPGSPVGVGDVLLEFDRHIQESLVIQALRALLRSQKPNDDKTLNTRDLSDRIKTQELALTRAKDQTEEALKALRARSLEYTTIVSTIRTTIDDLQTKLATASSTQVPAGSEKELEEAKALLRIAVEGNSLSQSLALSDIRTFFGADGTTTAFLKTIQEPQAAVPYWEKLLEAERLQRIVSVNIKTPPSSDPQAELQLLLTSKAVAEHALDIINGLKLLNDQIIPTNDYPLSEQLAGARLLERNLASMQAALDSLKIHEQRFLGLLEKQGQQTAEVTQKDQEVRAQLQGALADRSVKITLGNDDIRKSQATLSARRQKQSEILQEVERLKARYEYLTHGDPSSVVGNKVLEGSLQDTRRTLEDMTVRAVTSGVIEKVFVNIGDALHAGDPLVAVRPIAPSIEAKINDAEMVGRIAPGHVVEIGVSNTEGHQIMAGVVESVEQSTGTVRIVSVSFQPIPSGATLTARFTVTTGKPVVAIRPWLVVSNNNHSFVSVMGDNNLLVQREVTLGLQEDHQWVEVQSGLNKGQKITTPNSSAPPL